MQTSHLIIALVIANLMSPPLLRSEDISLGGTKGAVEATASVVYTEKDLRTWIGKWIRRDGAAGMIVSDYFCDFVLAEPALFFRVMHSKQEVFTSWVSQIEDLSFVDYGGCRKPECLRDLLIERLETVSVSPQLEDMRRTLLKVVAESEVRRIE